MSFQPQSTALGKHVFFFRVGDIFTVPAAGCAAGAATRNNKPDATDPAYIDLQVVNDWNWDIKSMGDEKIVAPSPGRLQLYDIQEKGAEAMIKFSTPILQGLIVELFYRNSTALTSAGGTFVPMSGPPRKGWIHTELYDNNNNLAWTLDVYVLLRVTGGMESKDGAILRPQFEANILYSNQNIGLLNNS